MSRQQASDAQTTLPSRSVILENTLSTVNLFGIPSTVIDAISGRLHSRRQAMACCRPGSLKEENATPLESHEPWSIAHLGINFAAMLT